MNKNKPVEQTSVAKKLKRQIPKGHRFSIKKTSVVHKKTMTPRSCLRWKPTGNIFKTIGLRWVPTGKIFTSSTTKVDSEPTNGSNDDITSKYECEQTLVVSVDSVLDDFYYMAFIRHSNIVRITNLIEVAGVGGQRVRRRNRTMIDVKDEEVVEPIFKKSS
ncbi:hypothetical protein Tco_0773075 [Tanacetum coccineum]|uniref:Uncharacterized protein n=1 Tax=Tanacetum coccineum TaxID=301880 RepID=A0ABQ4ZJQ5_9ASTR